MNRTTPPQLPAPLDTTSLHILECLREDGRMPNTQIAERLGISEKTVRNRIQRLTEDHGLRVVPLVYPEKEGLHLNAFAGIRISPDHLVSSCAKIEALPEVRYLAQVTGQWDLLVELFARSNAHLATVLLDQIGVLPGVEKPEVFSVLRVRKGEEWDVRNLQ